MSLSLRSKDRSKIKDQASLFGKTCFCDTFYPLLASLLYLRLSQGKSRTMWRDSFTFTGQLFEGFIKEFIVMNEIKKHHYYYGI